MNEQDRLCPACEKTRPCFPVEQKEGYQILKCLSCNLTFSHPMQAGDAHYYEAYTEYDDKWEFPVAAQKLQQYGINGALLDIGCGDGRFLKMASIDYTVTGLDFNKRAVETAKTQRELSQVYPLSLQEYQKKFPQKKFEVVTFFHVLEHMANPGQWLRQIKECLKPGGMIVLSVPHPRRWVLGLVREVWDYPPHHLTRWTAENLSALLKRNGFEVTEVCSEKVRRWSQVESGFNDVLWALALKKFSFGLTGRNISEPTDSLKKNSPSFLRSLLKTLKGKIIHGIVFLLTFSTFPFFYFKKCNGKSLLLFARLS